jgi:penicillin-binding protein 1A
MSEILRLLSNSVRAAIILLITGIVVLVVVIESNLPAVDTLKDVHLEVPLRIYTKDKKLIAEFGEKRRTPVAIKDVPQDLINAILATEDRRFYYHPGVDIRGIIRAAFSLMMKGTKDQGGSTITMQVARNFFLTRKKTYTRKISEILLALKIEQELSKDEILELYLNKIYLGKRAYGVAAAAEVYYGTTIDKLTLAQMAMIAGLPQAPSAINPLNSKEAAIKRRAHVLERMRSYNFINEEQFNEAINSPLTAKDHERPIEVDAPFVAEMVRQEMLEKYGASVYDDGYEVITTINGNFQLAANNALHKALLEYDKRHGFRKPKINFPLALNNSTAGQLAVWQQALGSYTSVADIQPAIVTTTETQKILVLLKNGETKEVDLKHMQWAKTLKAATDLVSVGDLIYVQLNKDGDWTLSQVPEVEGALVAMDPKTGNILSLVGGFDFYTKPFNRVTQAERQPGSNFKPFLYGAALDNGFTAASIINDAPIVEAGVADDDFAWRPQNDTRKFYGPTRLREAMTKSRNLVSIRLLKAIGIDNNLNFIEKFGFNKDKMPKGLSLALGTGNVTPLEIVTGYSVYANGGHKVTPSIIQEIKDYNDKVIFTRKPAILQEPVIKPQISYIISSLLRDAIQSGTGSRAKVLKRKDLSGKTGTTNNYYDAWYSGFNPDIAVTVWVGFDEPKSLHEYGARAALPMWIYFLEEALKDLPESYLPQPPGLVTVKIDPNTGLLAKSGQKNAIYEIFTEESVPNKTTVATGEQRGVGTTGSTEIQSLF